MVLSFAKLQFRRALASLAPRFSANLFLVLFFLFHGGPLLGSNISATAISRTNAKLQGSYLPWQKEKANTRQRQPCVKVGRFCILPEIKSKGWFFFHFCSNKLFGELFCFKGPGLSCPCGGFMVWPSESSVCSGETWYLWDYILKKRNHLLHQHMYLGKLFLYFWGSLETLGETWGERTGNFCCLCSGRSGRCQMQQKGRWVKRTRGGCTAHSVLVIWPHHRICTKHLFLFKKQLDISSAQKIL